MSYIVERLRFPLAMTLADGTSWLPYEETKALMADAADEIERKDTEIERLRDCLREFDEFAWTAVTADCEEARENLQRKIDKVRAALTASEAKLPAADSPKP